MDAMLFAGLDALAAIMFALSMVYLTKAEKYDDPGILPVIGLIIFGLIFVTSYTVIDYFAYSQQLNAVIANAWKDVTLPLAGMCFFIAAFLTKQLSDILV